MSASCRRHGILFTPYSFAVGGVPHCRLGRACWRHATSPCEVACLQHAGRYGWCVEPHTLSWGVNSRSCLRHGREQEVCYRCVRRQWLWRVGHPVQCRHRIASGRCGADWMIDSAECIGGMLHLHVRWRASGTQVTMVGVSSPALLWIVCRDPHCAVWGK